MTARPVVFISLERWDEVWRRNQHLLTRLRERGVLGDVLYVEPPTDPLHAVRQRHRPSAGRGLRPLPSEPGITLLEPTKLLPRRVDRGQDRRWARSVTAAAGRLGLRDPLLWVNDPRGAELLDRTGWPAIYDITDDWLLARRPEAELARLRHWEDRLLDQCAEVVVCSPALQRSKSLSRPVTLIPNAVDVELYARDYDRPSDLPTGRVAMYAGTLHSDRLDVELCCATAQSLAACGASLVLVGPDALSGAEQVQLDASRVIRLGSRPAQAIPAYLQHADVLVVPHLVTPFTESLDPIKAYEYAAAGRPVVSTPVAGFRELADVTVAEPLPFPAAVTKMLSTSKAPDRRDLSTQASVPTWSQRADAFAETLRKVP